jgi:hypothetical protein
MSSSGNQTTPDLASILKTLASLAPQTQQQQVSLPKPDPFPAQQVWQQSVAQATQPPCTPTPSTSTAKNVVDPATIIDWSAGLRCVMKQVTQHESIIQDIRRVCLQLFFLHVNVSYISDDQSPA